MINKICLQSSLTNSPFLLLLLLTFSISTFPVFAGDDVGDIKYSILDENTFSSVPGNSGWVLMDGRCVSRSCDSSLKQDSNYFILTGETHVPDARGRFLRGKNNANLDDPSDIAELRNKGNPDGEFALGEFQSDRVGRLTFSIPYSTRSFEGDSSKKEIDDFARFSSSPKFEKKVSSGGNETRPRNITVNIYIKVE